MSTVSVSIPSSSMQRNSAGSLEHSKNFNLDRPEFYRLVAALQQGDDTLFEQVFLTHFEACRLYLRKQYGASLEDAYDATLDTMVEFRKRLIDNKMEYGNLKYVFTQMAWQHYLRMEAKRKRIRLSEESITAESTVSEIAQSIEDEPEIMQALQEAMKRMCSDCKKILQWFYYDNLQLKQIAQSFGKEEAALRKQKERCIAKFKSYFFNLYNN